jgi:hypothetical protein
MSDVTAVLSLPFIQPAQAQKHVTHNEALRVLDVIVQLSVADRTRTAPPAAPVLGARHIVAAGATGDWAGQDGSIAVQDVEGWVFFAPLAGWRAEVLAENRAVTFDGTAWVAPGDMPQQVVQLGVNAQPDATNRLTVAATATLLNHAGNGHQVKVNKAAQGDTASLLFQSGFSGRAEMGLVGGDDFLVKVSADGGTFVEALKVAPGGGVALPQGALLGDGTALAPGLRFWADADTGLMRAGENQIALVTGGAARAVLSNAGVQVDVPVSGTAVQAGSHDATPGRLARVAQTGGLFGLGVAQGESLGAVPASADAVATAGLYRTDATTANLPASAASGLLEVFHGAGDAVHQRWTATSADTATRCWQRRAAGGAWQPWALIYNQTTLLGPVSQASGRPTGAVIERGSNANGEFVRFADGTQICRRTSLIGCKCQHGDRQPVPLGQRRLDLSHGLQRRRQCQRDRRRPRLLGHDRGTHHHSRQPARAVRCQQGGALSVRAFAVGRWF